MGRHSGECSGLVIWRGKRVPIEVNVARAPFVASLASASASLPFITALTVPHAVDVVALSIAVFPSLIQPYAREREGCW